MGAVHKAVGAVDRVEAVGLELHLVAVRVGVVQRYGDAVVNTPVGHDVLGLEFEVLVH